MAGKVVAVVGPGMMGRGIAACLLASGPLTVRLYGRKAEALPAAAQQVQALLAFLKENGVASETTGKLLTTASLQDAVAGADFVFESIAEDLNAKKAIFAELEALTKAEALLCTNTSSLSVSGVAEGCSEAGRKRVLAAHFIGPAHLVPLVELCPSKYTAPGLLEKCFHFLVAAGKKPIMMKKEIEGFIAARLQAALYRECLHITREGAADCAAIDAAVFNGFGRRLNQLGPFQQADLVGVDLTQRTHANFFPQLGKYERDVKADELVPQGRLGAKVLKGHHDWTEEGLKELTARRDAELLRRLKADRQARL